MFLRKTISNFRVITLTGIILLNIIAPSSASAEGKLSDVLQVGQSRIDHAVATQTQVNELATSTNKLKNKNVSNKSKFNFNFKLSFKFFL